MNVQDEHNTKPDIWTINHTAWYLRRTRAAYVQTDMFTFHRL